MRKDVKTVSINLSEDAAIKALSKLSHLGLDPTPDLYSIWYSYYKGDDCDLIIKVDKVIEENSNDLKPVHFLSILNVLKKENIILNDFSEDSVKIIDNTFDNVSAVHENTRRLGRFINDASNNKSKTNDKIIEEIQNETKLAMQENERLHEIILQERQKMEDLKNSLHKIKTELITDSLTTLHNRRHFDECLARAIKETSLSGKPLSLFLG